MGVSGAHRRSGVHPARRARQIRRRLSAEPRSRTSSPEFSAASAIDRASPRAAAGASRTSPSRSAAEARRGGSSRRHRARACRQPALRKNGRRIALIGAGCASLTVANDLAPLGYECVIFEALDRPGGLMRTNIPAFRLPAEVLDEEIGYVTRLGVDLRLGSPVASLRALLDEGYDAVFVGSGAPKGKDLRLPGRDASDRIHIGIDWLGSIAFGHVESIGERVLIIGVGNTAMDCCRSSLRLGAKDVKVIARKPRQFFKASDWELEDAEEERVEIVVNHSPKEFVIEDGKLVGMRFDELEYELDAAGEIVAHEGRSRSVPAVRRRRARDRPGERVPVDRARPRHRVRPPRRAGRRRRRRSNRRGPACSSAATRRSARRTSSGPSSTAIRPRSRSTSTAKARASTERLPRGVNLDDREDGHSRVELQQRLRARRAPHHAARRSQAALQEARHRGRARLQRASRSRRRSSAA